MENIKLEKQEAAFYFNQAGLNISGLDEIFEKQSQWKSSVKENAKKAIDIILRNNDVLQKVENYVFNFQDVTKDARVELEALLLKLVELRNFYSHYVHTDNVKILSNGEKPILEKYYQIAIEATGSKDVKLEITEGANKLTDAGVLFFLCMFLKKSQANKLISGVSGFKRNDAAGQPRRNLFTYFCVREGYKVVPDMQKHFLLFTLVNHLCNQGDYVENMQQPYDIGKGLFFHRIASTFLNISGILRNMKFYSYQSNKLKEQRGETKSEEGCFEWIEPFQGNSYFEINGHKGVIGEDELKELCYALLVYKSDINAVEGIFRQFFGKFEGTNDIQKIKNGTMLKPEYFPANYFNQPKTGSIKKVILDRLDKRIRTYSGKKEKKAYDKMKEVMEFINYYLPTDEKLKQKDFSRYLKMVRFWNKEKINMEREFKSKQWTKYFPSNFWTMNNLEDVYKLARQKNAELYNKLKVIVERMSEQEFMKYQQINDIKDLASLQHLAQGFGVKWEEKDWQEYAGQIKKQITNTQKLTIMKQRVTAGLKKKHGIENLNLRITIDSDKSRKAVLNRIAIPRGFIKEHILRWQGSEKVSKKIREAECKILLSKKYGDLSKEFFGAKDYDKMTQINGLYEKNKIIAFMVTYLMGQLRLGLKENTGLDKLDKTEMDFKMTDKVTVRIPFSQYPSLVFAISSRYVDNVDSYKFSQRDKNKPFLDKVDAIEKERMDFIKQVLGFEEYLFENNIIGKSKFTDVETHIGFDDICKELIAKGWDEEKINKLEYARNKSLHGEIPEKTSFGEAELLIYELKK